MKSQIVQVDGQLALLLPGEVAIHLDAVVGKELELSALGEGSITVHPATAKLEAEMAIVDEIMDEYDETLRILAQ